MTFLIYLILKAIASLPERYSQPAQVEGEQQEPCESRKSWPERTR